MQHASKRSYVQHESYLFEPRVILPSDRMPSLQDIVNMFTSGAPMDTSLERHLEYNELENNPVLQKGFDLADYSRIAKQNKVSLDRIQQEIEEAQLKQKSRQEMETPFPAEPPTKVE